MPRMKWNPITGRYEYAGGNQGTEENPDGAGVGVGNFLRGRLESTPSTTTTVPRSTTTTVPRSTTTSSVPKGKKNTTSGGRKASGVTGLAGPQGQETVTGLAGPQGGANYSAGRGGSGSARSQESPTAYSGAGSDLITEAINNALNGNGNMDELMATLKTLYGGGGGASSAEQQAAASRKRNRQMAGQLTKQAQSQYNVDLANVNKYYEDQQAQALGNIQKAMEEYRATLPSPTAYQNVPLSALPQTQQGLTQELLRQGATAQTAEAQMASDAQMANRIAEISSQGAAGIQGANEGYWKALQQSAMGAQTAAETGLYGNLADLRAQEQARLRQNQQDLLIQALKLRYGG